MTNITYDTDQCATPATLGFDVVRISDGKAHRLGTYASQAKAYATARVYGAEVITR